MFVLLCRFPLQAEAGTGVCRVRCGFQAQRASSHAALLLRQRQQAQQLAAAQEAASLPAAAAGYCWQQ